jgi:2-amino-4-hydroxy-6-hydroxymethyldihydropteridine diphosphokinase
MQQVFLLLGSNLGNREENLATALQYVAESSLIVSTSGIYKTAAWGKTDQPDFFNRAIELRTPLEADILLSNLLSIEEQMGRKRLEKWGQRLIDIDILLYGEELIEMQDLVVPHPQLHNRRFALTPLAEIAGKTIHPRFHKTIDALLLECADNLPVSRIL